MALKPKNPSFDIESWKKERAKIRSSRIFEDDLEFKPYEPKKFEEISIRPSWETRQKEINIEEQEEKEKTGQLVKSL